MDQIKYLSMKPTLRQARFIEEYLIDGNGAQAAIRAGYSPRSAKQQASRLLTYANLRRGIDKKRAEVARISGLRVSHAVQGLLDAVDVAKLRGDADAQISGWSEIAKILGFYPATKSDRKSKIDPCDIRTWPDEMLTNYDELP